MKRVVFDDILEWDRTNNYSAQGFRLRYLNLGRLCDIIFKKCMDIRADPLKSPFRLDNMARYSSALRRSKLRVPMTGDIHIATDGVH